MKRRIVLAALATLPLFRAYVAAAQPPAKIPRIGLLTTGRPGSLLEDFREALREFGYVDGKNVVIEARYGGGNTERVPELALELVRLNVDLIASMDTAAGLAAQGATKTIPIVGGLGTDPLAAGLIESLARPGANITGVTSNSSALGMKRLELLKDVAPQISPVAVLWSPSATGGNRFQMRAIESAARSLGLELLPAAIAGDYESAFGAIEKGGARSLIVLQAPRDETVRSRIIRLATKSRLPAIYPDSRFVDSGGLMSYAANEAELRRRQASYIDRVLKGAKPADLPVEAPAKFELVVNLTAAKQIGLKIPGYLLERADRVIG